MDDGLAFDLSSGGGIVAGGEMSDSGKTIGVLYAGELGAAVGVILRSRGLRVVTTLDGRGPRTAERCRTAGMVVLDSLAAVVAQAEVVISLVPPAAAVEVAGRYCEWAKCAPKGAAFVDMNSIGPERAVAIGGKVEGSGVRFVDGAINGLAKNLAKSGTLFFSGERAGEIADLFGKVTRVKVLGASVGRASAMKMLLGGLSKGVCVLFLELALVAERSGMLDEMLESTASIYPGIAALAERMLPTCAEHAGRRSTEMSELAATERTAGVEPCVIEGVLRMHELLAGFGMDESSGLHEMIQKLRASTSS